MSERADPVEGMLCLEAALELVAALRDSTMDVVEVQRCQAAWLRLREEHERALAALSPQEALRLAQARLDATPTHGLRAVGRWDQAASPSQDTSG